VEERFAPAPDFFRLAPEAPAINEKLWLFAETTYLDDPLHLYVNAFVEGSELSLPRFLFLAPALSGSGFPVQRPSEITQPGHQGFDRRAC